MGSALICFGQLADYFVLQFMKKRTEGQLGVSCGVGCSD